VPSSSMGFPALAFELLVVGDYDEELLRRLERTLSRTFRFEVHRGRISEPVDFALSPERGQIDARKIVAWGALQRTRSESYAVFIVDADAYVPGLNFVFGIANPVLRVAAVFTPRLESSDPEVFYQRLEKEVLHEVGHLLGLDHCHREGCVMNFSNSVSDVDRKSRFYCQRCLSLLLQKGYRVYQ